MGRRRVTIFAKGNIDLRDSLHACRSGDQVLWNGVNEVLRARHPGWLARLRHETWTRSDALLAAAATDGRVPAEVAERAHRLVLGPYPAASQFSPALFKSGGSDAVVLSIQPDVATALARHRRDGYLLYPNLHEHWPAEDRRWLAEEFDVAGRLTPDESMRNLERIVAMLRQPPSRDEDAAPPRILVYNLSAAVPGESVHCYAGLAEILSTRIRRFNLALTELSQRTGVSIIDVDAIVARRGADGLKVDALRLNAEGCRLVAEEVVRVLDHLGCFAEANAPAATAPLP